MNYLEFRDASQTYGIELKRFIKDHDLPKSWFGKPDHLAIKCADTVDFLATVEEFRDHVHGSKIWGIELDRRILASAQLMASIALQGIGQVHWVEIMEPRPSKIGKDFVGLEHMEFYYDDLNNVEAGMRARGLDPARQSNPGHEWVSLKINEAGQELKINDKTLADISELEQLRQEATLL